MNRRCGALAGWRTSGSPGPRRALGDRRMGMVGTACTGRGMATEPAASGLGEALASYQPRSMTPDMWARFRDDAIALTLQVYPTPGRHRVVCLGHLTLYLADMAETRPDADLADLLTRDQVEGYFRRLRREGLAPSTLRGRQGALNRFLTGNGDSSVTSSSSTPSQPYDPAALRAMLREAVDDGSPAALDFARLVLCGLSGHRMPPEPTHADLKVTATAVLVDGVAAPVPADAPLPRDGRLDPAATRRARGWAMRRLGFRLELRRLHCNAVDVVASRPAVEVLRCEWIGHDAVAASVRRLEVDQAVLATCLRDPDTTSGVVSG